MQRCKRKPDLRPHQFWWQLSRWSGSPPFLPSLNTAPVLNVEQSIRFLDIYHVHFNLKGLAWSISKSSDNSMIACTEVGCVHVLASSGTHNCFFPVWCITSVTGIWQENLPTQMAVQCDFAGFLPRVWHQRIQTHRGRPQRNQGVQVLHIHKTAHMPEVILKIGSQVSPRKSEGGGKYQRWGSRTQIPILSHSWHTYSDAETELAFSRLPVN